MGKEEEVREKWGGRVARTTTEEKGLAGAGLAAAKVRGAGDVLLWCPVRRCAGKNKKGHVPIELSALGNWFGLAVARLLSDVNLLVLGRLGTAAVVLVDVNLFFDVCLVGRVLRGRRRRRAVVVVVVDRCRDGFVLLFVTFPPVCRFRKGCFSFYLVWSVLGRCVSIRRREDTEGDRNLRAVSGRRGAWAG